MDASPPRVSKASDNAPSREYCISGSAIRGSSLLNTASDLRGTIQRGATIFINEVPYETAQAGEWTASCIQLTKDYAGETNFSVVIRVPGGSMSPKRKKTAGTAKGESQGTNISSTVQNLDSITELLAARLQAQDLAAAQSEPAKPGKKQSAGVTKTKKQKQSTRPVPNTTAETSAGNDQNDTEWDDAEEQQPVAGNSSNTQTGPQRAPRKLPPLPASLPQQTAPPASKAHRTPQPPEENMSETSSNRPRSRTSGPVAGQGGSRPKKHVAGEVGKQEISSKSTRPPAPTDKPPPPQRQTSSHTNHHNASTAAGDDDDEGEETAEPKPVLTEKSLAERRRLAAERVKRKLKEDQERIEREAAAKEAELQAQREASIAKAKELQARTASRVEQYHEEKLRREAQEKAIAAYEKHQRELVNEQFLSNAKLQKMKEIRKESKQRLQQIAQEEYKKAVEEAELRQKQLLERHKKYDVNTTFLPRLDGMPSGQPGRGLKDNSSGPPPGRVVKSLAAEMEQLESSSTAFPEEPVLRSRSAKQAMRNGKTGIAGTGNKSAGTLGTGMAGQPQSARRMEGGGVVTAPAATAANRIRDEDDWSDDEPDPFLQSKQHLLYNAQAANRSHNDDYADEDSLMMNDQTGEEEDDYGRLDDEMEMELFGRVQRSPPSKAKVAVAPPAAVAHQQQHHLHHQPQRAAAPSKTVGKAVGKAVGKTTKSDVDDAASDCSDLTADSMQRGRAAPKTKAGGKGASKREVPSVTGPTVKPVLPSSGSKLPRPVPTGQGAAQGAATNAVAYSMPLPSAFQTATNYSYTPQQLQQQVQFASHVMATPPPLPAQKQAGHSEASSPTPSPTRSKGKPVYRKLKPIPISQPYRPVPASPGVHE